MLDCAGGLSGENAVEGDTPVADTLHPVSRPRVYEQILSQLREHVAVTGLGAGDRLPPEREIAERLGVSRASIKQAIVILEVQGLVEIRHGGGTYLRTNSLESEPVDRMIERHRRLPDVLEAREALETKLAELAAARRTDDDLAALDTALDRMREEIAAGEYGEEGDRLFHAAITAAARNALLGEFMRRIGDQVAESRHESLSQPGRPSNSLAQHETILAAIRAQDGPGAAEAMRAHLATVSEVRLLSWSPDDE